MCTASGQRDKAAAAVAGFDGSVYSEGTEMNGKRKAQNGTLFLALSRFPVLSCRFSLFFCVALILQGLLTQIAQANNTCTNPICHCNAVGCVGCHIDTCSCSVYCPQSGDCQWCSVKGHQTCSPQSSNCGCIPLGSCTGCARCSNWMAEPCSGSVHYCTGTSCGGGCPGTGSCAWCSRGGNHCSGSRNFCVCPSNAAGGGSCVGVCTTCSQGDTSQPCKGATTCSAGGKNCSAGTSCPCTSTICKASPTTPCGGLKTCGCGDNQNTCTCKLCSASTSQYGPCPAPANPCPCKCGYKNCTTCLTCPLHPAVCPTTPSSGPCPCETIKCEATYSVIRLCNVCNNYGRQCFAASPSTCSTTTCAAKWVVCSCPFKILTYCSCASGGQVCHCPNPPPN